MWDPRLKEAIEKGDTETVLALMDQGADMNDLDRDQHTPLYLAVDLHQVAMIEAIMAHPGFTFTDLSSKAVCRAVMTNKWDLLPILLAKHTNKSIRIDDWGRNGKSLLRTALDVKDIESQPESVNLLLSHGCDPNFHHPSYDTPLIFAIKRELKKTVSTIIRHPDFKFTAYTIDALYSSMNPDDMHIFNELLEKRSDSTISIDSMNHGIGTLLSSAVKYGFEDSIDRLIRHGANPGKPLAQAIELKKEKIAKQIIAHRNFKFTLEAGEALYRAVENDKPGLAGLILEKHTDHSIPVCSSTFFKDKSPFRILVENGYGLTTVLLLEHGFTLPENDKRDLPVFLKKSLKKGLKSLSETIVSLPDFASGSEIKNILQEGLLSGYTTVVSVLLKKHEGTIAAIDDPTGYPNGLNALAMAVSLNHHEIVTLLLDRGANPNIELKKGVTPLSFAVKNRFQNIVKVILGHKDFKYTKTTGIAIMRCLETGQPDLIPSLLEKHSDKSILPADYTLGNDKLTAIEVAHQKGYEQAMDLLVEHSTTDKNEMNSHLRSQLLKAVKKSDFGRLRQIIQKKDLLITAEQRSTIESSITSGDMQAISQMFFKSVETQTDLHTSDAPNHSPTEEAPATSKAEGKITIDLVIKNIHNINSFSRNTTPLYQRRMNTKHDLILNNGTKFTKGTQTYSEKPINNPDLVSNTKQRLN